MKRLTKKLAKAHEFFIRNVTEYIVSIGAVPGGFYAYVLQTPIGPLHIQPYDNWIACRFDDTYAASVFGGANPHSGKWNFLYHDDAETLNNGVAIGDFVAGIERVLAYTPSPLQIAKAKAMEAQAKAQYAELLAASQIRPLLAPPGK